MANGAGSKEFPLSDKLSLKVVVIKERRKYRSNDGIVTRPHIRIKLADYPRPNHGFLPDEFNALVDRIIAVRDEINSDPDIMIPVTMVQSRRKRVLKF